MSQKDESQKMRAALLLIAIRACAAAVASTTILSLRRDKASGGETLSLEQISMPIASGMMSV